MIQINKLYHNKNKILIFKHNKCKFENKNKNKKKKNNKKKYKSKNKNNKKNNSNRFLLSYNNLKKLIVLNHIHFNSYYNLISYANINLGVVIIFILTKLKIQYILLVCLHKKN